MARDSGAYPIRQWAGVCCPAAAGLAAGTGDQSPVYRARQSLGERYCESFNGKLREECLNGEIFYSLQEARIVIEQWRQQYNRVRPHAAVGYRPPAPGAYTPPWNPIPMLQMVM